MKILKTVLLLFYATILLTSCGSSSDEDLGTSGEGTFTAKVDGVDFESLKVAVGATISNGIAGIQGSTSEGAYIRINLTNYNGTGSYKTGDALTNLNSISYGTVNPVATWISTFNVGSGDINITEDTATTISGTFTFTGVNNSAGSSTKVVTEGKFSAPKG